MRKNTIKTMEAFAGTVRAALEAVYTGCSIEVNEITKNNGLQLTGITVRTSDVNLAPTIYLNGYFKDYTSGTPMEEVVKSVISAYEAHKVDVDFDINCVTEFDMVKNRICFKVVNLDRNKTLLGDIPFLVFEDLAIIFYMLVSEDREGTATITVKNSFMEMWGIDSTEELFELAKANTQRIFKGKVHHMMEIMAEIIGDNEGELDQEVKDAFFQMNILEDDAMPMYVCTNDRKLNGAGVIFYDGLLKEFAKKIGGSFYILPSSIHESLFVPAIGDIDSSYLIQMVREINATEVSPEEVLSDNIYFYNADTDRMEMM